MASVASCLPNWRPLSGAQRLLEQLNGPWHKRALTFYAIVVLAHWGEHILQALQIWVLGWARPEAKGALGYLFPWLVKSEVLHYLYAFFMLVGFALLLPAFKREARIFWGAALGIQFWHHIEHLLLLIQSTSGYYFFGQPVPTSIVQLVVMRVELHLFYNGVVFLPMMVAVFLHMYSPRPNSDAPTCTCSRRRWQPQPAN